MLLLPNTLTQTTAPQWLATFKIQMQNLPSPIVLDGQNLTQFDSAALAALLDCYRSAQTLNKHIVLQNTPKQLQSLVHVYGLESMLTIESAD